MSILTPTVLPFKDVYPTIDPSTFVAPGAVVVGDVSIGADSSIWYGCVVRGDVNKVTIGERVNVQDGTVIHVAGGFETKIGNDVTFGHMALIHACTIEDGAFIGMKACVMDGAVVEAGAMVAAGALVTPGKRVPAGQLWAGSPAKYLRDVGEKEKAMMAKTPPHYVKLAQEHKKVVEQ